MTAYDIDVPAATAPFVFLPLDGSKRDLGNTGAVWSEEGTPWTDYPGYYMGGTGRCLWTDDAVVSDMFNVMKGATAGKNGRILFYSMKYNDDPDGGATPVDGGVFCHGSTTVANAGYQVQTSTTGRWYVKPTIDTTNRQLVTSGLGVTEAADTHVCMLFDFKNGFFTLWNDNVYKYTTLADRHGLLGDANNQDAHASIGVTLFSRNTGTSAGARTVSSPVAWKIWDLLAVDLTDKANPHQYAQRLQYESYIAGRGKVPKILENL